MCGRRSAGTFCLSVEFGHAAVGCRRRRRADGHRRVAPSDPSGSKLQILDKTAHRSGDARSAAAGTRDGMRSPLRKHLWSDCCASSGTSTQTSPDAGSICRPKLRHPIIRCSGVNCCVRMPSVKLRSGAKPDTFSASRAVDRTQEEWLDPAVPLRLESRERGHLDTLRFHAFRPAGLRCRRGADRSESGRNELPRRAQGARALSRRSAGCPDFRRRGGWRGEGGRSRSGPCRAGRQGVWPRHVRARFAYAGTGRRRAPHSRRALV